MSYIGIQYPDNATLFNGTLTATGVGSAIDTTGYVQSVWQVSGNTFSGIITVEASQDGVYWTPTLVTELSSLGPKTQIDVAGVYIVKADTKYIRYNVTNISGSASLLILGNDYVSSNPVDRLSLAMDPTNNSPVYTAPMPGTTKQDPTGALIPSDSIGPFSSYLSVGGFVNIDTTGYQTVAITTQTLVGTVTGSNDGINFGSITGLNVTTNLSISGASGLAASTSAIFPSFTRFIKITATTAGIFTYYLRNTNSSGVALGATINVSQFAGTAAVTGGLAGTISVGSAAAVGALPTTNPLIAGGIDPANLTRRLATTPLGDLITGNRVLPSSNAAISSSNTGSTPIVAAGYNNQVALGIQDTTNFEGQTQIELLAQILQELKILNQQIYELPRIQAAALQGYTSPGYGLSPVVLGDEPTQMRNDASLFIQQQ